MSKKMLLIPLLFLMTALNAQVNKKNTRFLTGQKLSNPKVKLSKPKLDTLCLEKGREQMALAIKHEFPENAIKKLELENELCKNAIAKWKVKKMEKSNPNQKLVWDAHTLSYLSGGLVLGGIALYNLMTVTKKSENMQTTGPRSPMMAASAGIISSIFFYQIYRHNKKHSAKLELNKKELSFSYSLSF